VKKLLHSLQLGLELLSKRAAAHSQREQAMRNKRSAAAASSCKVEARHQVSQAEFQRRCVRVRAMRQNWRLLSRDARAGDGNHTTLAGYTMREFKPEVVRTRVPYGLEELLRNFAALADDPRRAWSAKPLPRIVSAPSTLVKASQKSATGSKPVTAGEAAKHLATMGGKTIHVERMPSADFVQNTAGKARAVVTLLVDAATADAGAARLAAQELPAEILVAAPNASLAALVESAVGSARAAGAASPTLRTVVVEDAMGLLTGRPHVSAAGSQAASRFALAHLRSLEALGCRGSPLLVVVADCTLHDSWLRVFQDDLRRKGRRSWAYQRQACLLTTSAAPRHVSDLEAFDQ